MPDKSASEYLSQIREDLRNFLNELEKGHGAGVPLAQRVKNKLTRTCEDIEKAELKIEIARTAMTSALQVLRKEK
jgi:hypothetical protein